MYTGALDMREHVYAFFLWPQLPHHVKKRAYKIHQAYCVGVEIRSLTRHVLIPVIQALKPTPKPARARS